MQLLFDETTSLDQACYDNFDLTPDILMEHAANAVANYIYKHFPLQSKILIITGSGHNGADGLAVARILSKDYHAEVFERQEQKSDLGKTQKKRAKACGVHFISQVACDANVVVDALFGSGLNRVLSDEDSELLADINMLAGFKIAVDIPSGILFDGTYSAEVFAADITISMGALKTALFSDGAKDFTGEIIVANLGVSRSLYEKPSNMFVLDKSDINLPYRLKANTHKGSFGHACFISGEKPGASILAGLAALNFGAGLVTLIGDAICNVPHELMQSLEIPENCTALCLGMGLGAYDKKLHQKVKSQDTALIVDADLFYDAKLLEILDKKVVLTPHPKEFCALLKLTKIADVDVVTLQSQRLHYVKLFMQAFPHVVLLLKGAHVIIASQDCIYINPHGSSRLSKAGSGDVLSGLITALLAQGYSLKDATISASLAHTMAGDLVQKSSFGLTPIDLIQKVAQLG